MGLRAISAMISRPANTAATAVASKPGRGKTSSRPVGPVSVRSPSIKEKSPKAMTAARAASFKAPTKSSFAERVRVAGSFGAAKRSDLLDLGPAENSGRHEDQHQHEDRERGDVFVFGGKIGGPEGFNEPNQKPAKHGARKRSDSAQYGGGERLDAGDEADEKIDHAVIKQIHNSCDRR